MTLLLILPFVEREDSKELCKLVDHAQQHLKALANLGVDINSKLIVRLHELRLPRPTANKWDEPLNKNEFPDLDKLIEIIYGTAARLSNRKPRETLISYSNNHKRKSSFNENPENHKRNKVFVTTAIDKCKLCNEKSQPLFRCIKFRALPEQERIKTIKDLKSCNDCLRNHVGQE